MSWSSALSVVKHLWKRGALRRLDNSNQLGAKNAVPELAGNAKAELVVEEVVGKVVLLELLVPEREVLVVQEIVSEIVANVAKDAAAEYGRGHVPVPVKDGVGQLPEWSCQHDEEGGRHDEAIPVHGKVVVDTVQKEV